MSAAEKKAGKKDNSSLGKKDSNNSSSGSSPPSPPPKEKPSSSNGHQSNLSTKSNVDSPPAPVSNVLQSKASSAPSASPTPKAEPPKTSPPSPPEEKKSPAPNQSPKQSPKNSPPPPPPSSSGSPPSPPKQQPPPPPQQQTPTTPKQSPPSSSNTPKQQSPPSTSPKQDSPPQSSSTPTQSLFSSLSSNTPNQHSTPSSSSSSSSSPKQQSPPSPSNPAKKPPQSPPGNSPSQSQQPTQSSSDNNPSPPSPSSDTSQSPASTDSTSTPISITGSTTDSTPDLPSQTTILLPPPSPPISSPSPSPSNSVGGSSNNKSRSSNNTKNVNDSRHPNYEFVIGATVVAVLIVAVLVFLYFRERKKSRKQSSIANLMSPPANISVTSDAVKGHPAQNDVASDMENSSDNQKGNNKVTDSGVISVSKTSFNYEEMMEMTDRFARENMIGEGGFGCVYKGHLSDGKFVAVKQLKLGSGQGEREFRAEVEIISRVHHRHLVSLVGYCIANNQRLLIYEFVSNSTLERHLHDKELPVLEWAKRVKIAIGAARGLAYLHEDCHPKIIHRDIKSANILLDEDFEAQVADFGLARLNDTSHSHVSTRVMGTFGYLAPEYASSGKLTDRSDVYSFGVVILEIITGRKPVDPTRPLGDESLVEWARPLLIEALKTGDFSELVDPRLEKRYVENEMFRMMEAAAACVRHSATKRPRMALVARALDFEGDPDLSNGMKVGQSTAFDSAQYSEEITRFRRMEFGCDNSSEYDIYTDENISRELSGGLPNSGKSGYSSDESTIGESGTQGSKPSSSGSLGNYGGGRIR